MRRVAFLDINSFPVEEFTNGATVQYREILLRLRRAGVEVAVITICDRSLSVHFLPNAGSGRRCGYVLAGVPVVEYVLDTCPETAPDDYRRAAERALAEMRPDVVLINTPPARLEEAEVAMAEVLAASRCEVICFVPDATYPRPGRVDGERYSRFQQALEHVRVVCPSNFLLADVRAHLTEGAELLRNLFSPEQIVADQRRPETITFINPHPMKGVAIFENVAQILAHRRFLVVHGWPYPPHYKTPLTNVEVIPFQRDLRPVWSRTAVLLTPSLCREGFGRVVVEAQLNGVPVVGHRIGGLEEASGGAAWLIEPPPISGDEVFPEVADSDRHRVAEELSAAVEHLLKNPEAYDRHAHLGRISARRYCERAEADVLRYFRPRLPTIARGGTVVVAPHPDDVAFSLGGGLPALPPPVLLVTTFGRSNYTLRHGFADSWEDISRQRRAEDEAFSRKSGLEWIYLSLPEASLRWGSSFECVFAPDDDLAEAVNADMPEAGAALRRHLVEVLDQARPFLVVLPAALGRHRDHLLTRQVGTEVARAAGAIVAYYEDQPYASETTGEEICLWMADLDPDLEPIWLDGHRLPEEKEALVALYRSQVDDTLKARLTAAPERLWSARYPSEILYGGEP